MVPARKDDAMQYLLMLYADQNAGVQIPADQMAKAMTHIDAVLAISGHPIVAAREALGLSQSALAKALGVSRQTVHAWETQPSRQDRLDRVLALRK